MLLLRGGFSLCTEDFRFAFERFGALVLDRGSFAAGIIPSCQPLDVALQLVEFGAFLCHAYSFFNIPKLSVSGVTPMAGLGWSALRVSSGV